MARESIGHGSLTAGDGQFEGFDREYEIRCVLEVIQPNFFFFAELVVNVVRR